MEQKMNIQKAFVMDSGPYRVHTSYKHLTKTRTEWTNLGKIARERHLNLIHSCSFQPYKVIEKESEQITSPPTKSKNGSNTKLSISLTDSRLSLQVFGSMEKGI